MSKNQSNNFEIFHETVDKSPPPISKIEPIRHEAFKDTLEEDDGDLIRPKIGLFAVTILLIIGVVLSVVAIGCFLWVLVELLYIIGYKAF